MSLIAFRRLFAIRNEKRKLHREDLDVVYFDSKRWAKTTRDRLITATGQQWYVTRGPDHWREQGGS